jgi:hypothetical protein
VHSFSSYVVLGKAIPHYTSDNFIFPDFNDLLLMGKLLGTSPWVFEALSHRITMVFRCSIHDYDCSGDSTSLKLVQFPNKDFKILQFCFIPNSVFLTLTVCLPSPFGAQEPFSQAQVDCYGMGIVILRTIIGTHTFLLQFFIGSFSVNFWFVKLFSINSSCIFSSHFANFIQKGPT